MFHSTKGIVLKTIDYNDSSVIVKIYTERFGLQSYLVSGVRNKKSNVKINFFQPLSLVDMIVYHKEKNQLQKLKEIKIDAPFVNITSDIIKSSISLFLNEIIYKSIREEEFNQELFHFLRSSILYLDLSTKNCANFHLIFMIQFSRHLGFCPSPNNSSNNLYLNLQEGVFQNDEPNHLYFLSKKQTHHFFSLMNGGYENKELITINNQDRKELLIKLIQFYELHLNNIHEIKSHQILEEVIS